ncbi:MAG: efflux RND transporter periplasmic adaptor subunit [Gammaproteobacteria bacterium]|nr:efflux RND transporter periplasmic adaptor subunit [Gammaproteobacteria bacterium]
MKSWMWTPLVVLLIAGASYYFYIETLPPELEAGFLYGNGHVEGTEISVAAELSGRVLQSNLEEGREVSQGELLVALDATDIRAAIAKAEAEVAAIEFEEIRVNEQRRTWRDMLATAERDLVRYQELRNKGLVAEQRLDQSGSVKREALGQVRALEAQLQETRARTEVAKRNVEVLGIQLARTEIYAPLDATILTKGIELGELASPGRMVAVLVDLNDLELKVYLPEAVIGKVKLNDDVRVRVNAFPDRHFDARVKRVDQKAQFTPRDINMPEERVRMVFGVVLALDNSGGYLKPGMPADAWIRWDPDAPWPETLVVPR